MALRFPVVFIVSLIPSLLAASTSSHPPDVRWIPTVTSASGHILWSTRNFTVISERDEFSFELRTQFAPNVGVELSRVDAFIKASCKNRTAQVITDKVYGLTGEALSSNVMIDAEPITPQKGSVSGLILNFVCSSGPKEKPKPFTREA